MNVIDYFNPYAYAMKLRRLLYRKGIIKSVKVSVPVISIGNLSMGGTGKTPFTLYIARYCIETLEKKTAIILRGYKRKSTGYLLVSDGKNILESVDESGDEAQLYAHELSEAIVICDEDRVRGAQKAIALGAEVILLDDGFQHLRLKRDLNILLINSDEGIPAVLPIGKGREPDTATRDADIIIQTNFEKNKYSPLQCEEKSVLQAQTILSSIHLYSGDDEIDALPEILIGEKVIALSGIANPERFERSLALIASSVISYRLPDHAEYDRTMLEKIISKAKAEKCGFIATTTKDAVKMLAPYRVMQKNDPSLPPLAIVQSEVQFIHGEEILLSRIKNLLDHEITYRT